MQTNSNKQTDSETKIDLHQMINQIFFIPSNKQTVTEKQTNHANN